MKVYKALKATAFFILKPIVYLFKQWAPAWMQKFMEDRGSQAVTAFVLIGGPLMSILQTLFNGYRWFSWPAWETAILAYFFYGVILFIAWTQRNTV